MMNSMVFFVVLIFLIAGAILIFIPKWYVQRTYGYKPKKFSNKQIFFDSEHKIRQTLLQFFGGIGLLATIYFGWTESLVTKQQAIDQNKNAIANRQLSLFSEAVKILGSTDNGKSKIESRIGSVQMLKQLAIEDPEYKSSVIDILTNFMIALNQESDTLLRSIQQQSTMETLISIHNHYLSSDSKIVLNAVERIKKAENRNYEDFKDYAVEKLKQRRVPGRSYLFHPDSANYNEALDHSFQVLKEVVKDLKSYVSDTTQRPFYAAKIRSFEMKFTKHIEINKYSKVSRSIVKSFLFGAILDDFIQSIRSHQITINNVDFIKVDGLNFTNFWFDECSFTDSFIMTMGSSFSCTNFTNTIYSEEGNDHFSCID